MKKTWKKLAGICLALSMVFSATGCDAILDGISDAFQSATQSSTPNGSTPSDSTPDDSTPDDSTPDSTPGDSTPDSTPSDSTPDSTPDDSTPDDSTPDDSTGGDVSTSDNLSIHFLELGTQSTGDSTYIKAGDVDILIDAGAVYSSAATIERYVDQYCEDGKLEYVIATHAHEDHIAGFVGTSDIPGVLEYYDVGTIIDFPRKKTTSNVSKNYVNLRDNLVANEGTKHYTALEWWNGVDGMPRTLEIANGITMTVLYQKYYETSSDENNYSVCVMFSENDNHYLFTGDLEESGEKSLVENNNLPKMKLYKAGHHGSKTSSSSELMRVIQPEIVCVCCCAGSSEYTNENANKFPTQTFINNVAPYTDQIFVTTLAVNGSDGKTTGHRSMNGNIVVSSLGGVVSVNCTNNNTILKETDWFMANRTWPSNGV